MTVGKWDRRIGRAIDLVLAYWVAPGLLVILIALPVLAAAVLIGLVITLVGRW